MKKIILLVLTLLIVNFAVSAQTGKKDYTAKEVLSDGKIYKLHLFKTEEALDNIFNTIIENSPWGFVGGNRLREFLKNDVIKLDEKNIYCYPPPFEEMYTLKDEYKYCISVYVENRTSADGWDYDEIGEFVILAFFRNFNGSIFYTIREKNL